jgi:hypothetical protein
MFINPDNPLSAEILQEAGQAYFSACKQMVRSLDALRAFDNAVRPRVRDHERVRRRSQLLDEAAERVHSVLVQRDAIKLSGYKTFVEDYGIPVEVLARMGRCHREQSDVSDSYDRAARTTSTLT